MKILVTGGAGFIGSAVIERFLAEGADIVNLDKFTYAATPISTGEVGSERQPYVLEIVDIADREAVDRVFRDHQPNAVVHLAGGTHVDRSIDRPDLFVRDNLVGTLTLLEAARSYWRELSPEVRETFRFIHVSTTEVFGSLRHGESAREDNPYHPASPYAASKAGADHLMEAWFRTYGFPTITTHCTNNYGPRQFPEKLVPLMILNALEGKALPRDRRHRANHGHWRRRHRSAALWRVLLDGQVGSSYNIGGGEVCSNLDLVKTLCAILDEKLPNAPHKPHAQLLHFVADRPGHESWNAVDTTFIRTSLGWQPKESLESGLRRTVDWYLSNADWWRPIRDRVYGGERLGQTHSAK